MCREKGGKKKEKNQPAPDGRERTQEKEETASPLHHSPANVERTEWPVNSSDPGGGLRESPGACVCKALQGRVTWRSPSWSRAREGAGLQWAGGHGAPGRKLRDASRARV